MTARRCVCSDTGRSVSDFELVDEIPRHGGRREGAGRPRTRSAEAESFDKARARHEAAKAELAELDLKVKTGEYVARSAVRQAAATASASLAQTLRSIPDNLERRLGVAPEVAEEVGRAIDAALNDLADEFQMMTAEPEQGT
jgi:phage terminase Nu1 subunit (DNA packaging protein)